MSARKKPVAFGEVKQGVFVPPPRTLDVDTKAGGRAGRSFAPSEVPPMVRYSTALKRLRALGADTAEFERDKKVAAVCPEHGEIADPVIALSTDRVAFACPWCSDPTMLKAWEEEGKREKRS
jgi:hypothetical protein